MGRHVSHVAKRAGDVVAERNTNPGPLAPDERVQGVPASPMPVMRPSRLGVFVAIFVAHALLIGVVQHVSPIARQVRTVEPMVMVFVSPRVVRAKEGVLSREWPVVRVLAAAPPMLTLSDIERPVAVAAGVGRMVPRLADDVVDSRPYAKQANLHDGEGATVVLRLEVLDSGLLGHVEVELSGGTEAIDGAAIDYARSMPWIAGELDGHAITMWIRWGVRLQA